TRMPFTLLRSTHRLCRGRIPLLGVSILLRNFLGGIARWDEPIAFQCHSYQRNEHYRPSSLNARLCIRDRYVGLLLASKTHIPGPRWARCDDGVGRAFDDICNTGCAMLGRSCRIGRRRMDHMGSVTPKDFMEDCRHLDNGRNHCYRVVVSWRAPIIS